MEAPPWTASVPAQAGGGPGDVAELEARLAAFISAEQPSAAAPVIEGLSRSDVGYSRENWTFDARWEEGGSEQCLPLIMRRDPAGSVLTTDRNTEYFVLKALEATAIPSPRARWLDAEGAWFGRPSLVMDRIEGECRLLAIEGPAPLDERRRLAHDCLGLLSEVHRVDWRAIGLGEVLGGDGGGGAAREVAHWAGVMRTQQMEPNGRLDDLVEWLEASAPQPQAQVLVHGDFKPGNMLLRDGRIAALLDWETAHIGDPVEDVGWITNPLRRREHQIPGEWETAQIVDRYQELTGFVIRPEDLRFWNVLANYKLAVIVLTGIRSYAEGRSDRPFDPPTPLVDLAFRLIEGG